MRKAESQRKTEEQLFDMTLDEARAIYANTRVSPRRGGAARHHSRPCPDPVIRRHDVIRTGGMVWRVLPEGTTNASCQRHGTKTSRWKGREGLTSGEGGTPGKEVEEGRASQEAVQEDRRKKARDEKAGEVGKVRIIGGGLEGAEAGVRQRHRC